MNGVTMTVCAAMAAISLVSAVALGQQSPTQRQSFIAVTVADLDASVRWYETFLGARRVEASRAPSGFAENERSRFDSTLEHLRRLNATFVGGVFSDSTLKARSFIVKDNSGVLIQFFTSIP